MACKGSCKDWKLHRTLDGRRTENAVIYEVGYKWCRSCRMFIPPEQHTSNRCNCCNNLLRSKSRNLRMKDIIDRKAAYQLEQK